MFKTQYPEHHTHNGNTTRDLQNQSYSDELQRNWKNMQNAYRLRYPNLTDKDVDYKTGVFEDMTQRVAARINRSTYEVEDDICILLDN